ncbi:hypothetical protein [Dyadobacter sp. CY326]|uniref:hypothetical protein n=1 Tax=Dyadobacter sp. CY326 TaxID=2907300 RepID=UPI001F1D3E10|nr:hypothetical protein [Dyadobacter sp. CY326]MCE7065105.1 hypothetical protein [Dyadobacter sp. CY326]
METKDFFDEMPFVNEECGDTMWNEENLNPPTSKKEKLPAVEPGTWEIKPVVLNLKPDFNK